MQCLVTYNKKPARSDFIPLLEKLEKRLDGWRSNSIDIKGRVLTVGKYSSLIHPYLSHICFALPNEY